MILDVVIPLLLEHGPAVTSRQIAEAAGIAEGTIFRVFGDKETVVSAAIDKYFDPEPFRDQLRHISPDQPIEVKLRDLMLLLRERFAGIFRLASVVGDPRRGDMPEKRHVYAEIIAEMLAPEAELLNWPAVRVAHIARLIAFAASIPLLNDGVEFDDEELTRVLMYGVIGRPSQTPQG